MTSLPTPAVDERVSLDAYTTFRCGGEVRDFVVATTADELTSAVRAADRDDVEALLVAGGSNLLIGSEPFKGRVIFVRNEGIDITAAGTVLVGAGTGWDAFVADMVLAGYVGVEALSGIPGAVGSTPVQNVGAYGQEVAQTIRTVHVMDRTAGDYLELSREDCEFSYRHSLFKENPGRYVITAVEFALDKGTHTTIGYSQLASALGVDVGDTAKVSEVRAHVLALRAAKGMVLDPGDHDTWSAGSFFTNPIIAASAVPQGAPVFPVESDEPRPMAKTSAAWLIDHAGFDKGFAVGDGKASLSTKHTLALTNRGDATAEDVCRLASVIRQGVYDKFGVTLVPEPNLIGCALDPLRVE